MTTLVNSKKLAELSPTTPRLVINTDTNDVVADFPLASGSVEMRRSPVAGTPYSAFEVYAHDTEIPKGALPAEHLRYIGEIGDTIYAAVPASMTEEFQIRSEVRQNEQDVVIDWGDGFSTYLGDITPTEMSGGEFRYRISHTYTAVGLYVVRILGRSYFGFMGSEDPNTTLLSKIFTRDLPLAPWVWNMSAVAKNAPRLLHVNVYSHSVALHGLHWSRSFTNSQNLISAIGFTAYNKSRPNCQEMFSGCANLKTTDFRLPESPEGSNATSRTYEKCYELAVDVSSLLPTNGFKSGSTVNVNRLFHAATKLTGTVPAKLLWLDTSINWVNTSEAFDKCSADIRAQVPTSWGGTAPEPEIGSADIDALLDKIQQLEQQVATLQEAINGISFTTV